MANTNLTVNSVGAPEIYVNVNGVEGSGPQGRQVTLQAATDVPGFRFNRWVVTKTPIVFAIANGPFSTREEACSTVQTIDIVTLYIKNERLFLDTNATVEAPVGYYYLNTQQFNNQYIYYNRNIIPQPSTCPSTSIGGGGGGGGTPGGGDSGLLPPAGGDDSNTLL